jgi:hypothetical protein
MQITITTMKYRNTNYISLGTIALFLIPIVGITVMLTLTLSDVFQHNPLNDYTKPKTSLIDTDYNLPADTPEFQTGDQARFNFTGDTVLVLNQAQSLNDDEVRVLYKSPQGSFQTVDLPDNWLVKINTDSVPDKPSAPPNDKLEQYKKRWPNE